ncbi:MAG: NADH:flavin oxidoreductase [Dehalococcoidia bacterium]|jgi:2,4-dienoyl-CoA reductase-like NADH-dependent reductase (Old Yellow Enzyme family)
MYDSLFEPIKIGPVQMKNRVAMAPMNSQGDKDGHPTMQYMCYYNARALGGFGMMTTGSIITSKEGIQEYPLVPYLYPGSFNGGYFFDFVEGIHSMGADARIFAQLSPGFGRQTGRNGVRGASPIPFTKEGLHGGMTKECLPWTKYWAHPWADHLVGVPREMTIEEIQKLERGFINSADMAILAGFDGIEIHAPHGYLLSQFLSPRSNQRKDEYGGSLRNRARIVLELVAKCKEHFGNAVPIVVRLSATEYQPEGNKPEDVRQICVWCEENGADAISLSNSSGYDDGIHMFGTKGPDDLGKMIIEAQGKKLKKAIKIPVIIVGLHTPEVAARAIEEGETDMVALGRQAMADPDWPNKVKEGRVKEIVRCTKDMYCLATGNLGAQIGMRCTQNPNYGFEQYNPAYWPKPQKAKVHETLMRWKPGTKWQTLDPYKQYYDKGSEK